MSKNKTAQINTNSDGTKKLKLNYKNTLYIGCAFFSILMLWQVYNHYCPIFLEYLLKQTGRFEDGNEMFYIVGMIMAGDNLFAMFMLPIFGKLSDKTNTKIGKRMPYIIGGMIASAILFPLIAIMFIFDSLVGVIVMMGIILIIMNIYRNPAVALMPDVTPKPLRSKANGIINFVGYLGGIVAAVLAMFIKVDKDGQLTSNYKVNAIVAFSIASLFMIAALLILVSKIKEKKLIEENKEDLELGEQLSETVADVENEKLTKTDKRNLWVLLFATVLWFMSFNAIETFNSLFCKNILGNSGYAGTIVIILTITSILTFLLGMNLPTKIGRKNTILIGLTSMIFGFACILVILLLAGIFGTTVVVHSWTIIGIYVSVAFCGIGWALINTNSYPMLVELSSRKNVGKFTGYYYTASMLAQTLTPVIVGLWMSFNSQGLRLLYIYSIILMVAALAVFLLFKDVRKKKQ